MSGIGPISPSTAIRVIHPVGRSMGADTNGRDRSPRPRLAYATIDHRPHIESPRPAGVPTIAAPLAGANDNGLGITPAAGAIAYLVARDRLTDLPAGFLITRMV